jgi:hypothetical protein
MLAALSAYTRPRIVRSRVRREWLDAGCAHDFDSFVGNHVLAGAVSASRPGLDGCEGWVDFSTAGPALTQPGFGGGGVRLERLQASRPHQCSCFASIKAVLNSPLADAARGASPTCLLHLVVCRGHFLEAFQTQTSPPCHGSRIWFKWFKASQLHRQHRVCGIRRLASHGCLVHFASFASVTLLDAAMAYADFCATGCTPAEPRSPTQLVRLERLEASCTHLVYRCVGFKP